MKAAKPPLISAAGRLAKPLTFIRRSIQSAAEVNAVAALDAELITSVDHSQCDQPSIRVFPMRFNWLSLISREVGLPITGSGIKAQWFNGKTELRHHGARIPHSQSDLVA